MNYHDFKHRIDMDALESELGFSVLRSHNDEDIGYCIFPENHQHGDTTGKLHINRTKKVWHCWVCGGGDLVSLVMLKRQLDPRDAVNWLYQFATNTANVEDDRAFIERVMAMLEDKIEEISMPYYNKHVLDRFEKKYDYFYHRGISRAVCTKYLLCHCDNMKQTLGNGEEYRGPAAIFPHFWNDTLVGYQCRWIEYGNPGFPARMPKWKSTPDFPRESTIFNYHNALRSPQPPVLCESAITTLFLESCGFSSVASFGAYLTDAQARLLRRFNQGVIIAPDNDSAGKKMSNMVKSSLLSYIPVYQIPEDWCRYLPAPHEKADFGDFAVLSDPCAIIGHLIEQAKEVIL